MSAPPLTLSCIVPHVGAFVVDPIASPGVLTWKCRRIGGASIAFAASVVFASALIWLVLTQSHAVLAAVVGVPAFGFAARGIALCADVSGVSIQLQGRTVNFFRTSLIGSTARLFPLKDLQVSECAVHPERYPEACWRGTAVVLHCDESAFVVEVAPSENRLKTRAESLASRLGIGCGSRGIVLVRG